MNQEDKDILLRLLQQHKKLGISEQRVYQKFYLDSVISNSVALSNLEPEPIAPEMVDKWSIKPSLAEKMVDILEFGRPQIFPWLTSTGPHDCISKGKTSHPYILQTL